MDIITLIWNIITYRTKIQNQFPIEYWEADIDKCNNNAVFCIKSIEISPNKNTNKNTNKNSKIDSKINPEMNLEMGLKTNLKVNLKDQLTCKNHFAYIPLKSQHPLIEVKFINNTLPLLYAYLQMRIYQTHTWSDNKDKYILYPHVPLNYLLNISTRMRYAYDLYRNTKFIGAYCIDTPNEILYKEFHMPLGLVEYIVKTNTIEQKKTALSIFYDIYNEDEYDDISEVT